MAFSSSLSLRSTTLAKSCAIACAAAVCDEETPLLVLFSVITSCSCVKPEISRKPIAVGGEGEIVLNVEVDKMEQGVFHRVIQIRSNSVGGTEFLTIEGVAKD